MDITDMSNCTGFHTRRWSVNTDNNEPVIEACKIPLGVYLRKYVIIPNLPAVTLLKDVCLKVDVNYNFRTLI